MRNLIIVLLSILIIAGSAFAQQPDRGISAKGIKLGFGSSMMTTDYESLKSLFEFKIGFHGGVFLTYNFSPKFSIQPELLLSVKGTKDGTIISLLNWSMNYIEIPILIKYNLAAGSGAKPTLYAGPSLSLLTSSELKIIFVDAIDVTDYLKKMDLGFAVGASIDIKRFSFETRYTFGFGTVFDAAEKVNELTKADPTKSYYFPEDPTVKNRFLSFMIGFRF